MWILNKLPQVWHPFFRLERFGRVTDDAFLLGIEAKLAGSKALFERARERGEIRADVDIELLAPALAGIVLHRFFLVGERPTKELVESVIDQIILPAAGASHPTVR